VEHKTLAAMSLGVILFDDGFSDLGFNGPQFKSQALVTVRPCNKIKEKGDLIFMGGKRMIFYNTQYGMVLRNPCF